MREDYRDYHKINHGDGRVEIFDHGLTLWEHHGIPVVECSECGEMTLETELDKHDGICDECFRYAHTCWDCDKYFPDTTLETDSDRHPLCEDCLDLQERLEQIKPIPRTDMVALAKKVLGVAI